MLRESESFSKYKITQENMTHPSMVKVNLPYSHMNSNVAMIYFLNYMEGVSSRDDKDGLDEVYK